MDQPSLRFLKREDPATNFAVFHYTRHKFGANNSPLCGNYELQRTPSEKPTQNPEVARSVRETIFMDE